jgi:hypothetical protein
LLENALTRDVGLDFDEAPSGRADHVTQRLPRKNDADAAAAFGEAYGE